VVTPAQVRSWGKHAHGSPLYAHLVEVIAADDALMAILNRIEHLPQVNLLLGAVQYLLLTGPYAELGGYYQSLVPDPMPAAQVDGAFREFVLGNQVPIVDIGNSRYTQTNECRRCVALLPLVMTAPFDRFHVIEIGASAGLNLALDLYRYRWGDWVWGPESGVTLVGESRGAGFPLHDIDVLSRIGLDLDPIEPDDIESRNWLDALIWPEQVERRQRLRAALDLVAGIDLELIEGDALQTLPEVLAGLPAGEPVVVMDAFSLNQLSPQGREQIERIAEEARAGRHVFRVSMELLEVDDEWAKLAVSDGPELRPVGQAHPHGEWLELWPGD
jgi:hypothetical protein